ncbi:MAG: hypothetical protein EORIYHIE_000644 [Candidatus Fervidibacter sp.]|jgi:hypothetical protein
MRIPKTVNPGKEGSYDETAFERQAKVLETGECLFVAASDFPSRLFPQSVRKTTKTMTGRLSSIP